MIKLIEEPFDTIPEGFYYFRPCNGTGKNDLAEIRTRHDDCIRGEQIGFVKWYNMPVELQERYKRDIESFDRMHKRINDGSCVRHKLPDGQYVYGHSCDCSVEK